MAQQLESTPALLEYVRRSSLREDDILRRLRAETSGLPAALALQVTPEQGQFLALLVGLTGASRVLDIGTFTGYSSLSMARALPPHGRLVTMDISEKWPSIGAPFWREAHVADRIDLRVGDAQETLAKLRAEEGPESFDLAFVDADKAQYAAYYEAALDLLRPGGLIVLDNTLFFGRVIDPAAQDADTVAIRELNQALLDDDRVDLSLLPLFDGITLARKRSGAGGPSEEDRP
ncbi:class I SAM-dependent methyltransferase [Streptomyces sp. NBC_00365]|uniref:O-methyltransferase n=1 Tax=Streptomyces sp. NBC_00365 TaxID=2975726 RepID=UPI0022562BE9|nr:class I SAM-dependent methyltransferase [Streptomyces sp. NBC_00365]MCX5096791.1 class I SAM-dependent methyltransferase [Streptomyces sp. NBC_00365]